MKRCPKCGGNVPDENKICYNCGQQMGFFSGKSNIGPMSSKGNNTVQNPFEKKGMNSGVKAILIIFGFFFIMPFIVAIIGVVTMFSEIGEEFGDVFDDITSEYTRCESLCGEDEVVSVNDSICECANGTKYDEYGGIVDESGVFDDAIDNVLDDLNNVLPGGSGSGADDNLTPETGNTDSVDTTKPYKNDAYNITTNGTLYSDRIIDWYEDIASGKTVVTVVGASWCSYCKIYEPIITKYANDNNIILHFVKVDLLTDINYSYFMDTYDINFPNSYPYTYVMKNGKLVGNHSGYMEENELRDFLNNLGI